jgi:hypothetical protein
MSSIYEFLGMRPPEVTVDAATWCDRHNVHPLAQSKGWLRYWDAERKGARWIEMREVREENKAHAKDFGVMLAKEKPPTDAG